MPALPPNLLAFVTQRGSVARMGDVTILRMDGAGAIAAPSFDYNTAARWAQGRPCSGIIQKDRMLFLERFELLVARPNSIVQTRGSAKPIYDLLKSMERIGLDIHEWSIPHAVEEMIKEESGTKQALSGQAEDQGKGAPGPKQAGDRRQ